MEKSLRDMTKCVEELSNKASKVGHGTEAMQYSQAALNISNAMMNLFSLISPPQDGIGTD